MIYVTGDTHGHIDMNKLSAARWPEGKTLTENDVVIICGDFGLLWDAPDKISGTERAWTKWLNSKPWTTLFVDGNHENFHRIYDCPVVEKYGGKVHKVSDKIFHLMRGEYYNIQSKTFWVFGGATSVDKWARVENISWWAEEMPTYEEMNHGIDVLMEHNMTVDYILTHCAPRKVQTQIAPYYESDQLNAFFNVIYADAKFKHWYCGHYHTDETFNGNFTVLYKSIQKID